MIAILCSIVQGAWAWDGEGTSANPYKIRSSADWKQLADDVSGGMYTLTYERGGAKPDRFEYAEDICAPFIKLDGATIRHLKVKGSIFSRHKHCAGSPR
jgi:hypothetical protein